MKRIHDYCIILAGGIGRRLWPVSRRNMPKQFIDFTGVGRTLLQQTYDRVNRYLDSNHIFISTYKDYTDIVKAQLPDVPAENILAEPVQLSTAPAAAWVSCHIGQIDPEARIICTPSDQFIQQEDLFAAAIERALDFAGRHSEFVALAVRPTVPNTAYGYIQRGRSGEDKGMFRVKSFVEKPAMDYAKMFVESGEFLWNTGLFAWHNKTMMSLVSESSDIVAERILESKGTLTAAEELEIITSSYQSSMHRSLDLMILEKTENVYVMQADFGWADVGCWPELYEVTEKDNDGNALLQGAGTMLTNCRDNLIRLPENMAAVVTGLNGYLIAIEGNVLVVCPNTDPTVARKLSGEALIKLGEDFV